jgi:hypothetical protein
MLLNGARQIEETATQLADRLREQSKITSLNVGGHGLNHQRGVWGRG